MKDKNLVNSMIAGLAVLLSLLSLLLAVKLKTEIAAGRRSAEEEDALRIQLAEAEAELETLREEQAALQRQAEELRAATACRDGNVRSVAHRGVSSEAPENTLPAFRLAAERGFSSVETDLHFTKDSVPVCIHDGSIDRTSNGSGNVADMTLEELRQYDFGSWMGEEFAGTRIPTFEEYLSLCKNLGLQPYIELKTGAAEQIQQLVETVNRYGMRGRVSWISFEPALLNHVRLCDDEARLGCLISEFNVQTVNTPRGLRSGKNEVFLSSCVCSDWIVEECRRASFPLELWTLDTEEEFAAVDPYVTGVTSDTMCYGQYLYEKERDK